MPLSGGKGSRLFVSLIQEPPSWLRFLLFGFLNTVVTVGIFVSLGSIILPALAYGVAFFVGLLMVLLLANRWAFHGTEKWGRKVLYLFWYLLVFLIGQAVIYAIGPVGPTQLMWTSGVLISITVPISFIVGRVIFR